LPQAEAANIISLKYFDKYPCRNQARPEEIPK
jgi:hypothetical protein